MDRNVAVLNLKRKYMKIKSVHVQIHVLDTYIFPVEAQMTISSDICTVRRVSPRGAEPPLKFDSHDYY